MCSHRLHFSVVIQRPVAAVMIDDHCGTPPAKRNRNWILCDIALCDLCISIYTFTDLLNITTNHFFFFNPSWTYPPLGDHPRPFPSSNSNTASILNPLVSSVRLSRCSSPGPLHGHVRAPDPLVPQRPGPHQQRLLLQRLSQGRHLQRVLPDVLQGVPGALPGRHRDQPESALLVRELLHARAGRQHHGVFRAVRAARAERPTEHLLLQRAEVPMAGKWDFPFLFCASVCKNGSQIFF